MLKVEFEVKGELKEVIVDFFSKEYGFINHLKRSVNNQVKGALQKTTILHLVNKGIFVVKEDDVVIYINNVQDNILDINQELKVVTKDDAVDQILDIDFICCKLDLITEESTSLHIQLQQLLTKEQQILQDRILL